MGIKNRDYCCTINKFNTPTVIEGKDAIASRLMTLFMMEPGDDPLHPDMGVGIKSFRYGVENLDKLKSRIESQIKTYLPIYQNANINIIVNPNKTCNVEIVIGNSMFVYDSSNSTKPIVLQDLM